MGIFNLDSTTLNTYIKLNKNGIPINVAILTILNINIFN